MTIFTNFLRSLFLTTIFSCAAPMLLVGGAVLVLSLGGHVPGLQALTDVSATRVLNFLAIFGSGSAFHGLLVIGLTCGFVGALFDTYAYYRCQILRIDS